ncbi:hypothetical protein BC628DRAFT_991580 [Trametes gibbosa]|nr:hypothetical protein BC628DRAFT_991580 [Trametes gibbosa]
MSHMPLDFDILLLIMSLSDNSTICVFARTCRTLNLHSATCLLQNGVSLDAERPDDAISFVQFVTREGSQRLHHLLFLTIKLSYIADESLGLHFLTLFQHILSAGRLRGLEINDVEWILHLEPGLAEIIVQLESLQTLHFHDVGPLAATLLWTSRSFLVSADLRMNTTHYYRPDDEPYDEDESLTLYTHGLLPSLHGSQATLQKLSISSLYDMPGSLCFPNLLELTLLDLCGHGLSRYMRVFPNLQVLSVNSIHKRLVPTLAQQQSLRALRVANRTYQEKARPWASLQRYTGPTVGLYILAFSCPIRSVILSDKDYPTEVGMIQEVLDDARPCHLELSTGSAMEVGFQAARQVS